MKTRKYILFVTVLTLLAGMSARAQQSNVLTLPDMTVRGGTVQQWPVAIENTDEIVAVQFDLTLPEGFTTEAADTAAGRCDGHVVSVKSMGSRLYRVLLYSLANRPLRGQSGTVFTLPVTASSSLAEGSEHQPVVSKALLTAATGENVLTDVQTGKIRIGRLPDLVPEHLVASQYALTPGDAVTVQWQVENAGDLPTGGGWDERIELVSGDNTVSATLATVHCDTVLAPGATVSRKAEVLLPAVPAMDGSCRLRLTILPTPATGEPVSSQGNNTVAGSETVSVEKVLTLTLSTAVCSEGSDTQLQATLTRSGRRTVAQTFTVSHTPDTRLKAPTAVVIAAGQSSATFTVTIGDDDVAQPFRTVSLTLTASGNGYPAAEAPLQLVDDENSEFTDITLDEDATAVDYADGPANVLLRRALKVNSWNTLCLPFAMTKHEVETAWGQGSQVASLEEVEYESETFASLRFRIHSNGIEPNKPCLLLPTQNVPEVSIPRRNVEWQAQPEHALTTFTFKGTYVSGQSVPVGDYYLSNDVIYRSQGMSTMKGYRGWFHDNLSGSAARQFRLRFVDDDETTFVLEPVVEAGGHFIYDLRGVKRTARQRGITIENNKKILRK